MKLATSALVVLSALMGTGIVTADSGARPSLELMPVPASLALGDGHFTLDTTFAVTLEGAGVTPRLRGGVQRMLRRLSDRSGLFFAPAAFLDLEGHAGAPMVIGARRAGSLTLGEDESYRLTVSPAGVRLEAETDIGALRGLETFLQLVVRDARGITVPTLTITDAPRFPWRGLMIDSSRHFMPVAVIERNLDGMAAVKLNVLHWHLSDDQGFRVETRTLPKLPELASDGRTYTRAQIREVIAYAADRGIRVVPEFDLPGHATSWVVAYPELASAPGPYRIERGWGIFDPTIDPTRKITYRLLDDFFGEMASLFDDQFIHIGGDENNGVQWEANPDIQAFAKRHGLADTHALQAYFNQRVQKILARHGRRMIGWDEILQPELPTTILIQSWRGRESLYDAARRGYSGILSNGYYIDLIQPTELHYLNDPLPADAPLSPEERRLVLGGEATMWAEYVTPETVGSRIWPRTAAIAERLWSPGTVRDVPDMYRRLERTSLTLEELGLQHIKNRDMMLRRLCGCRDTAPLETLVGAIEPVKIYRRGQLRKDTPAPYTQFSPLTRLVDAAWPDAEPARRFRWATDSLLATGFDDPHALADARASLRLWLGAHAQLLPILLASPALTEMTSLSEDLSAVALIGLEALEMGAARSAPPSRWLEPRLERLAAARRPRGEAELMIVDPVARLACAAAGQDPAACVPAAPEEE